LDDDETLFFKIVDYLPAAVFAQLSKLGKMAVSGPATPAVLIETVYLRQKTSFRTIEIRKPYVFRYPDPFKISVQISWV